jgi:hypothetical protein
MQTENYGFTIKYIKARTDTLDDDFDIKIDTYKTMTELIARHKAIRVDYTYEYDSMNRVHIHGHMLARKGIRLNLYKKPYWHVHIDHLPSIDDVQNWIRYIHKESSINEYKAEYMFI